VVAGLRRRFRSIFGGEGSGQTRVAMDDLQAPPVVGDPLLEAL